MSTVTAVTALDLDRYLGLWYEIGRLPLRFEDDTASAVTAEYSLEEDGSVRVDNRCWNAAGEATQAIGRATLGASPAQLRVSFLPRGLRWLPFTEADYWVLRIDAAYEHALVGTPDHRFLWLLARSPRADLATAEEFLATALAQGFDLSDWIITPQPGTRVRDLDLDQAD